MADRFPSLEDFDSGAQPSGPGTSGGDDFLAREKALLGDDADQFATGNDNAAFVEDGDEDLLGGGGSNEEVTEFESSFPAIDTRNEPQAAASPTRPPTNPTPPPKPKPSPK
ncbi:hypothetical protein LSUE1_G007004 [Lachnellula suecica]|uniref:Clathrin light chain n=1 Tax=Lachnellula suecica TaxID=602035 RepID=A0A8T9C036_9HELO|nr:hypothetical protein LSUE1_G007004 [Lachnellula suecica]